MKALWGESASVEFVWMMSKWQLKEADIPCKKDPKVKQTL